MALGEISLSVQINDTRQWALIELTCTGMTQATVYRVTSDGTQAVRGAFNVDAAGALVVADYEAPQNTDLTYFARITDGTQTRDSSPVSAVGTIDRGGDVLFGLTNPLASVDVIVAGAPELRRAGRQEVVQIVGRADPVVVTDVLSQPSGTLSIITLTAEARNAVLGLVADGGIVAFSPHLPTYGFSDVWYLAVASVTEKRLSPIGHLQERQFDIEFQRVAAPPAQFVGPAFRTWQDIYDAGITWGELFTSGTNWLRVQVS